MGIEVVPRVELELEVCVGVSVTVVVGLIVGVRLGDIVRISVVNVVEVGNAVENSLSVGCFCSRLVGTFPLPENQGNPNPKRDSIKLIIITIIAMISIHFRILIIRFDHLNPVFIGLFFFGLSRVFTLIPP